MQVIVYYYIILVIYLMINDLHLMFFYCRIPTKTLSGTTFWEVKESYLKKKKKKSRKMKLSIWLNKPSKKNKLRVCLFINKLFLCRDFKIWFNRQNTNTNSDNCIRKNNNVCIIVRYVGLLVQRSTKEESNRLACAF